MNNDLISRSALKKTIDEVHQKDLKINPMWGSIGLNTLNRLIDNAPTVSERTQGEWIDYNAYYKTCSICKRTVGIDFLIQKYEDKPEEYSFCPNCGAKMKGGAE